MRSATAPRACACSAWWRERTGRHVCGPRHAPGVRGARRHRPRNTAFRAQPFADLIDAFVQDQTVTRYRDWDGAVRLLPQLRQSRRPPGAVPLRLLRRAAPAPLRRHLHGPATRQLLAGRDGGSAEGPRLHSARRDGAARLHRRKICRAALHPGLPRRHARDAWRRRASFSWKACRWWAWSIAAWRSISTCSAAAACACSKRSRRSGYDVLSARPAISKSERVGLLLRSLARTAFSRAA